MNFKNINIGLLIKGKISESEIEIPRICNFFKCTEKEIEEMFLSTSLDTELLLRWSKLLQYDFFRLYSQHLILYSPPATNVMRTPAKIITLPQFRKNIYTKELINFILEQLKSGAKTRRQIIEEYKIPKTTLYKWINKYN